MKGTKVKVWVLSLSLIVILSTASYAFLQIKQNHQANMLLINDCEGTVRVETNLFKLSTAVCEKK